MKKRLIHLLLVLSLFLCPFTGSVFAESVAERRTIVPEGVVEIDLRAVLGDATSEVQDAWMLNADVCVLLRSLPALETKNYELIVLNVLNLSILSRTPVPLSTHWIGCGWEDDKLCLLFDAKSAEEHRFQTACVKATIATDGAVDIGISGSLLTIMPGGDIGIREAFNGSLYAVDLYTAEEKLLIQGVAGLGGGLSYEDFLAYVPCPDDVGYDGTGPWGSSISFPEDEDAFQGWDISFFRQFYVYKALDEYRFIYAVNGWEWGAGFGVYDLQTRTDHRITGRGNFYGMGGNILYGSTLMADADTYESLPLPDPVQEQLDWSSSRNGGYVDDSTYSISPDGRLLALTGMKLIRDDANTVTITEIQTGKIIKTYDIYNPFATECKISFYDDTHFMLFCVPKELGSAYIYLFEF